MAPKGYSEDESARGPRAIDLRAGPSDAASAEGGGDAFDPSLIGPEPQDDSPFLRVPKRVPVRRGPLPKKAANRLKHVLMAVMIGGTVAVIAAGLTHYGRRSWRFQLDSSDRIQISGNHNVGREPILDVFGADISRNVFLIPLDDRRRQLEQIPWVETATIMRLLPNRLQVQLRERTPVAYVQVGTQIKLVDPNGVLMDVPAGMRYSFPVILGFTGAEPLSQRSARMRVYQALLRDLDSAGANYSRDINEVDLSDSDDVRITVTDAGGEVLIHLGASSFLDRYKIFVAHAQEWLQQYQKLESVDLRYAPQIIVKPDSGVARGTGTAPADKSRTAAIAVPHRPETKSRGPIRRKTK